MMSETLGEFAMKFNRNFKSFNDEKPSINIYPVIVYNNTTGKTILFHNPISEYIINHYIAEGDYYWIKLDAEGDRP